jgi:Ala-tRNA(Pro) deacylase
MPRNVLAASEEKTFDGHGRLMGHLEQLCIAFQRIEHAPEGRTEAASVLRGHPLSHAAKCLVLEVRYSRQPARYVNCVVPGDQRLDYEAIRGLLGGRSAHLARPSSAGQLTGCPMGAVTPFSFHPELDLVADSRLLEQPQVVFNAGRLDLSLSLTPEEYLRAARPRLASIAT